MTSMAALVVEALAQLSSSAGLPATAAAATAAAEALADGSGWDSAGPADVAAVRQAAGLTGSQQITISIASARAALAAAAAAHAAAGAANTAGSGVPAINLSAEQCLPALQLCSTLGVCVRAVNLHSKTQQDMFMSYGMAMMVCGQLGTSGEGWQQGAGAPVWSVSQSLSVSVTS